MTYKIYTSKPTLSSLGYLAYPSVEMKFTIEITETLQRTVEINAESPLVAVKIARQQYYDDDLVMDWADFMTVDFEIREDTKEKLVP